MYKQEKFFYKRAFFYALLMAVLLLLPFVVIDGGYFIFYGDYNAQQIPFYKTCMRAVQEGNFGWNWQTDLGANFIGSYSFYTLGSPFFWLVALLPPVISQYLMFPLLALKLALASLFAFMYIRRFVNKPQSALIGGILYAFSGFSMNNIFFNHFHEAIVFFPLLLIGLEEMVVNKRKGLFALTAALNAFVNYFFFIGECVFLVIYFVSRIAFSKEFRISVSEFFCLAFESVIGVAIAGLLFIPSIFQVLDVPRSTDILNGSAFMFYATEQRYGLILEAMFFPPEIAARTNMFTGANAKWSSVALYLPLFSMAGTTAFFKGGKHRWLKCALAVCLVMAFIPGLNAAFTMFNDDFYTRWFYMPTLLCCLATVYAVENSECDFKFGIKLCSVAAGIIAAVVIFHPAKQQTETTNPDGTVLKTDVLRPYFMTSDFNVEMLLPIALAVVFTVLLGLLIKSRKTLRRTAFVRNVTVTTVVCSLVMGYYFVGYGRIIGPKIGSYNKSVSADITIDDEVFFRMEGINEINNVNMLWDMSSLKSFTSIIPSATFELYDTLGINRSVNSAPEFDEYAFRSLANVKYMMVREDYDEKKLTEALDKLKVYEYTETQNGYKIYKNNYAFPMGFAYDQYITAEEAKGLTTVDKLMCCAVILTDEQAEKYSDVLSLIPIEAARDSSFADFKEDAADRIAAGVSEFKVTNTGFTAKTNYAEDELVVFSVPFDKGWSATVNGEAAEVEKVNGGFIAARVAGGESEIVFTYETPGLKYGIIATLGGVALLALYCVYWYVIRKQKPDSYAHLNLLTRHKAIKAHYAYINQLTRNEDEGE